MRRSFIIIGLALAVAAPGGCSRPRAAERSRPKSPAEEAPSSYLGKAPAWPLAVAAPAEPGEFEGAEKLSALDETTLADKARAHAREGKYDAAARHLYWAAQKNSIHQYELAGCLARARRIDEAFYYLQAAALEDGVDSVRAEKDIDLAALWSDKRWPRVRTYLRECETYWQATRKETTLLWLPKNHDKRRPLTALVALHRFRGHPGEIVSGEFQKLSDDLGIAVVAVSGPIARGKKVYEWSSKPEDDHNRIVQALEAQAHQFSTRTAGIIALGFGQGAQVGLEAAVRHPQLYAGAIAVGSAESSRYHLERVLPSRYLARRGFVFSIGGSENKLVAQRDQVWTQQAGARVHFQVDTNSGSAADLDRISHNLRQWVKFIEEANK